MKILGISAYYHDSAAVIIEDGLVLAAAQEERFTRIKHDENFPKHAIKYCLVETGIAIKDLDAIVFYDKPFLKFERLLQNFMDVAPKGWWQFIISIPSWLKQKLFIKKELKEYLEDIGIVDWTSTQLLFSNHHLSHAASSFFAANYKSAAILTIDGVGEWATASISIGQGNTIKTLKELYFPNSLGLMYSAFTYFLGFKVNSGEYKVMGLAPYADRESDLVKEYYQKIKAEIVEIHADGSIQMNQSYFEYASSYKMINSSKFEVLFGFEKRKDESDIEHHHYSLAQALQLITEEVVIAMANYAKELTGESVLCMAGGVALNCVANGKLLDFGSFEHIYIQPASGDAGNALGAALAVNYMHFNKDRVYTTDYDQMAWSRLGPSFTEKEIRRELSNFNLEYQCLPEEDLLDFTSKSLAEGKNVAWFQGRMEFGPRSLGGRSILGNPLLTETQSILNVKVKKRESFRPFAPIMLEEEFFKFFGKTNLSPYMLFVHKLLPEFRLSVPESGTNLIDRINQKRSNLPAITHIDYSARIQTVNEESDALMFALLQKVKKITGVGMLVNTSFNLRGEPIVCSPKDAIQSFLSTELDILVLGNCLIEREHNTGSLKEFVKVKED